MVAQHRECAKYHRIVHFKWLILCYLKSTSIKHKEKKSYWSRVVNSEEVEAEEGGVSK